MTHKNQKIHKLACRIPAWTDFLFWEGGRADLEELRHRWLSEGCSGCRIAVKSFIYLLSENIIPKYQELAIEWLKGKQSNLARPILWTLYNFNKAFLKIFPRPHKGFEFLDDAFFRHYYNSSIVMIRVSLVLGLFLYSVFGILDVYCIPSSKEIAWIIRYVFVCPVIMLAFLSTFFKIPYRVSQVIMSFMSLVAGYGIIGMISCAKTYEIAYETYYTGLILVLIFLYTVLRLRLSYAITTGCLILLGYEYVAIFHQGLLSIGLSGKVVVENGISIFINNNFFFVSASILGVLSCSFLEKAARDEYVMRYLMVEEVFREFRRYFDQYDIEEDEGIQDFLEFLSIKPRNLEEMLFAYWLYKASRRLI